MLLFRSTRSLQRSQRFHSQYIDHASVIPVQAPTVLDSSCSWHESSPATFCCSFTEIFYFWLVLENIFTSRRKSQHSATVPVVLVLYCIPLTNFKPHKILGFPCYKDQSDLHSAIFDSMFGTFRNTQLAILHLFHGNLAFFAKPMVN